jgi:hypothetical protein
VVALERVPVTFIPVEFRQAWREEGGARAVCVRTTPGEKPGVAAGIGVFDRTGTDRGASSAIGGGAMAAVAAKGQGEEWPSPGSGFPDSGWW